MIGEYLGRHQIIPNMSLIKKIKCLEFEIFADELQTLSEFNQKTVINTINAYSYVVAKKDPVFSAALKNSDILLPDGFPIVMAIKYLTGNDAKKIAGNDIFEYLLNWAGLEAKKVFFLGSSEVNLSIISEKVSFEFPNISVNTFSPPYKSIFTDEDDLDMINIINEFSPDILFVGMTAPKQEKWVFKNREKLNTTIICSVGAVFDFYSGKVCRPSHFWIKLKLEWFIRLLREPKRLWRRYLIYSPKFFAYVLSEKVKKPKI